MTDLAVRCRGITKAGSRCKKETSLADLEHTEWWCPQHVDQEERDPDDLPPTLGPVAIDWMEHYLVHGPGDVAGEPIEFSDEFAAFVYRAYELRPDGTRRWRRGFLSRPKGAAKTELVGFIGAFELLGPCRFDGWDSDGNPVGRVPKYREILSVATEEHQGGMSFSVGAYALENGLAADEYQLDIGLTRIKVMDGSTSIWEPITTGASSKDGGKSTFVAADETHLWIIKRLHQLHTTITRNLVKRRFADGWMMETSTAWRPGQQSVAESSMGAYLMNPDGTILVDHRSAPLDIDVDNVDSLRKGLLLAYGEAAEYVNIEGIIESEFGDGLRADPTKTIGDSRRYFLNQVVPGDGLLVDPEEWDSFGIEEQGLEPFEVPPGARVVLGFDGSVTTDCTVLSGWWLDGPLGPHLFPIAAWERGEFDPESWEVPREEVREVVKICFEQTYNVVGLWGDPSWWSSAFDDWADAYGPERVVKLPPRRLALVGQAVDTFLELMKDGGFSHAADEILDRHIKSAALGKQSGFKRVIRVSDSATDRIDGAISAVMGYAGVEAAGHGEQIDNRAHNPERYKQLVGLTVSAPAEADPDAPSSSPRSAQWRRAFGLSE